MEKLIILYGCGSLSKKWPMPASEYFDNFKNPQPGPSKTGRSSTCLPLETSENEGELELRLDYRGELLLRQAFLPQSPFTQS